MEFASQKNKEIKNIFARDFLVAFMTFFFRGKAITNNGQNFLSFKKEMGKWRDGWWTINKRLDPKLRHLSSIHRTANLPDVQFLTTKIHFPHNKPKHEPDLEYRYLGPLRRR
jgi:hypothetical protein